MGYWSYILPRIGILLFIGIIASSVIHESVHMLQANSKGIPVNKIAFLGIYPSTSAPSGYGMGWIEPAEPIRESYPGQVEAEAYAVSLGFMVIFTVLGTMNICKRSNYGSA